MTGTDQRTDAPAARPLGALYAGNARSVMLRGWQATRSTNWLVVVSGFFEPIFYLLSMGLGLGTLVGTVTTGSGQDVPYAAFIAPALLAVAGELDATPTHIAIAWLREKSRRSTTALIPILGSRTRAQLDATLGALNVQLSTEQVTRLDNASAISLGVPHGIIAERFPLDTGHDAPRPPVI